MTNKQDILIELGTEELPPKALKKLANAFARGIVDRLDKAELSYEDYKVFATPRRLAIVINDLDITQADKQIQRRGPALQAAVDALGKFTKAAEGFARSCGVNADALEKLETEKGSWLVYNVLQKGQTTAELLPEITRNTLARLPIPKRMRWGDSDVEFVRPVHWLVMLQGEKIIPCNILGINSGRETRGHRFHNPQPITVESPESYEMQLQQACVIANFDWRRELIEKSILECADETQTIAIIDDDLLDEVTALTEWPTALIGRFDETFLEMPAEVLISSMKDHQKYFHVTNQSGELQAYFIAVININTTDPDAVIEGNERVIRPRLADAAFFWDQDRKHPLDNQLPRLSEVVFQKQLGTLADKSARTEALAIHIGEFIHANREHISRAAVLAKCDLLTDMVGEFPSLQGLIGKHYARHQGEVEEVAVALDEQYKPRFAGDNLPETPSGQCLAVADKLDTVVGIFGIGQPPTGDKDPFALRRATLGLLRIIIEQQLDLDLKQLIIAAVKLHADHLTVDAVGQQVFDFMMERLRAYFLETGIETQVFDAVLARSPVRPLDFQQRLQAVTHFQSLPAAESLAAANKRIRNILRKSEQTPAATLQTKYLTEEAERTLAESVSNKQSAIQPLLESGDYAGVLSSLADLREPVDNFFDQVMVMCDDEAIRLNRLKLLSDLSDMFLEVADISLLQS